MTEDARVLARIEEGLKYIVKTVDEMKVETKDGIEKLHTRISATNTVVSGVDSRVTVNRKDIETVTEDVKVIRTSWRRIWQSVAASAILAIIGFLLMTFLHVEQAEGGVIRTTLSKTKAFVLHPQTLKYGFYGAVIGYAICDALRDSDVHARDYQRASHETYLTGQGRTSMISIGGKPTLDSSTGPVYSESTRRTGWHTIKQFDRAFLFSAGAFLAGAYTQGHITGWGAIKRTLYAASIAYPTWRLFYTKNKFNQWHTTKAEYNRHLIPYFVPWDLRDRYIAMSGNQVTVFYGALAFYGGSGLLWRDPASIKRGR
jgi:hypothetical protein